VKLSRRRGPEFLGRRNMNFQEIVGLSRGVGGRKSKFSRGRGGRRKCGNNCK
jgi:hypothetical protein